MRYLDEGEYIYDTIANDFRYYLRDHDFFGGRNRLSNRTAVVCRFCAINGNPGDELARWEIIRRHSRE